MRMLRIALLVRWMGSALLLLAAGAANAGCDQGLRMGWKTQLPFLVMDRHRQLGGLDYDVVSLALSQAGCAVRYDEQEIPWKRQLVWVEEGRLDFVVGASKTADRERYARFSAPYRSESAALFVRVGESSRYPLKSLHDILDTSFGLLGVYRGSYYGPDFERWTANTAFRDRLREVSEDDQSVEMLAAGHIDGFLMDTVAGTAFLRKRGELGHRIERHPLPPIETGQIYVMFSRKTVPADVVERFNRSLEELRRTGAYDTIAKKYTE